MARKSKKVTLNEFRAWLEGVEELQPKDWSPNAEQWQVIRDKISSIKDEPVEKVVETKPQPQVQNPVYAQQPTFIPPPQPQSAIPIDAQIDITPEAKRLMGGEEGATIKTPNIDTSDGKVKSPFA